MAKRKEPLAAPYSERLKDLMAFVAFTNKFRAVKRTIWFAGADDDSPERDGEHSFQNDLVALYLNERLGLGLNPFKLSIYAKVHDLPEYLKGDASAFPDLLGHVPTLSRKDKESREKEATAQIERDWGSKFPTMVEALHAYRSQKDEESRFIYALEKLVAVINIYQDGGRTFKRTGANFEEHNAYKTPRVRKHPVVKLLYDELRKLLKERESELFPVTGTK